MIVSLVFAMLLGGVACDVSQPGAAERSPGAARPSNILVIIADDVGVDQIGVYGEGSNPANTPNIDALARQGVLFRNTWSNPVCSSTRATILTGRYSFRTGVGFVARHGEDLKDREHTLPEILARHPSAQYGRAAFGKWHLNAGRVTHDNQQILAAPFRAGFSSFRGTFKNINRSYFGWQDIGLEERADGQIELSGGGLNPAYNTSEIVNHTAEWIRGFEEARPNDPWFVWLAFNAAHQPFHKPPASLHTVDLSDSSITCTNRQPFLYPENLLPCYHAMIEAMDTEIGRLLKDEISKESLERTTIIFLGDNGSVKGIAADPRRALQKKGTPYEGGINVPLVIAGAGVEGSNRSGVRERSELVNTTDLFATVLELAGLDPAVAVPAEYRQPISKPGEGRGDVQPSSTKVVLDSISILPLLSAKPAASDFAARRFAYAELFRSGGPDPMWPVTKAIRDPLGYKLIQFYEAANDSWRDELYQLDVDPDESTNLLSKAMDPESHRAHLRLRAQLESIATTGWSPQGKSPAVTR